MFKCSYYFFSSKLSTLLTLTAISFCWGNSIAQTDSSIREMPSNSYKKELRAVHPDLIYEYDETTQTHNYSGNWDIDGDTKKDSVYFIGNGGAHLYFHLRLILSSEKTIRDFSFLFFDLPYLSSFAEYKKAILARSYVPQFAVSDSDGDGKDELFVNFDSSFSSIPNEWKKKGLNSRYLRIKYQSKKLVIENFKHSSIK